MYMFADKRVHDLCMHITCIATHTSHWCAINTIIINAVYLTDHSRSNRLSSNIKSSKQSFDHFIAKTSIFLQIRVFVLIYLHIMPPIQNISTCLKCNRVFSRKVHLEEHQRKVHNAHPYIDMYRCRICGCDYKYKKKLFGPLSETSWNFGTKSAIEEKDC